jgi:cysteine desulfurase
MKPYFGEEFANPHSSEHFPGWEAARSVDGAAASLASFLGADPDEIIFTSGANEANNLAVLGLGRKAASKKRRRLLVSAVEHKCVLAASRALCEQLGFQVEFLPVDGCGGVEIDKLSAKLDDNVLCVSVGIVNNEIGTIQNVDEIARLARVHGALVHCDAAQGPCAVDLSRLAEAADFIALSGHKMYGPKGIGALYVKRSLQGSIEPIIYGGGQQRNLRSGTVPTGLCVGLAASAGLLCGTAGTEERARIASLRDWFVELLLALPFGARLNGPPLAAGRHPGNANVRFEGFAAHDILGALQPRIAASTGAACSSGMTEPSHVLRAIGMSEREAEGAIRFSLGRFTTAADIEDALGIISGALASLAKTGAKAYA